MAVGCSWCNEIYENISAVDTIVTQSKLVIMIFLIYVLLSIIKCYNIIPGHEWYSLYKLNIVAVMGLRLGG